MVIGFIGAVLGVGGGFILVPALIYFFRIPPLVVVGTSLFQILVTMTGATMLHAVTNQSVDSSWRSCCWSAASSAHSSAAGRRAISMSIRSGCCWPC